MKLTRAEINKTLNELQAKAIDTIQDTANVYAPGDRELWKKCVQGYYEQIIKLFTELKQSCNDIVDKSQQQKVKRLKSKTKAKSYE